MKESSRLTCGLTSRLTSQSDFEDSSNNGLVSPERLRGIVAPFERDGAESWVLTVLSSGQNGNILRNNESDRPTNVTARVTVANGTNVSVFSFALCACCEVEERH